MINLRNSPFLWFALLLILAYALASGQGFAHGPIIVALWLVCLVGCLLSLLSYQPGKQLFSTIAIIALILSGGIIRYVWFSQEIFPHDVLEKSIRMQGLVKVTEVLKMKENSISLRCHQLTLKDENESGSEIFTDKFIVVHLRESELPRLYPGDHLLVSGWVSAFQEPLNPHAFDIRKYYKSIGIRHQMTCKRSEAMLSTLSENSMARVTAKWQSFLCGIVSEHTSPDVAQLTNALVWGDRTYMNEEIRDAFADSGAMHVLSVSGMHMAMIYSMLLLVLGPPGAGSYTRRMVRLLCYALAIILYMGLTGACPAVVRSGLMILLYLLGKAMGWNTPIWNLLGFAAFLMVWSNPFVCLNIGFQLSFLAMAGILLYAQPMIRYVSFKQIILHRTWEITAVSIAAQVFILPVLLRQFYQFPLTFIASSMVAMPASYIIIFGSLLNICLSGLGLDGLWPWYDVAGRYFILIMKWMAGLNPDMNYSLPSIAGIFLLGGAILFSFALVYRWPFGKKAAYVMGFAAILTLGSHRVNQWGSNELVIYHHFKGLLVDVMLDGRCYSIQDTSITPGSVEFSARGHRCHKDVISTVNIAKNNGYHAITWSYTSSQLRFPEATIYIWNENLIPEFDEISIRYLLVTQCTQLNSLKTFICNHADVIVILPAHLERYPKNILLKFLRENEIRFWDISEKGYFSLAL
jgi:ComEC/Rec2-related protein